MHPINSESSDLNHADHHILISKSDTKIESASSQKHNNSVCEFMPEKQTILEKEAEQYNVNSIDDAFIDERSSLDDNDNANFDTSREFSDI